MVEQEWMNAEIALLDIEPWKKYPCPYHTFMQLLYSENAIYVHLSTKETELRAVNNKRNSPVWEDSCMEFFFSPDCDDIRYINIEINPIGTLLIYICEDRNSYEIPCVDEKIFNIKTIITNDGWEIFYQIPFSFITTHFNKISKNIHGNFYKCGDKTEHPHFGCWQPIAWPVPNFHLPEFIGEIIL